ncbi:uncharacterized protein LOC106012841 isoform X2 [Aplysia californica]|uniref:Uncharacterized protein LOC106012841 isoform X2 n=1 Tax=Aplysia californica TaxID=6500 RepID=A0ABM1A7N5_APLCA|nr:uncharacterized protein LOC106012841 isoform X2 [Aplysia californica]
MNKFGTVFLCAALLVGAAIAQNEEALCGEGCNLLCNTVGSLCVDVYPLINCAANRAACAGSCGQTCSCNARCLNDCHARKAECEAANANTFNVILCKSQVTICTSACPITCAGQALTQNIQQVLGQALAGVTKAAAA